MSMPSPIPLGNPADQAEMQRLIRKGGTSTSSAERHPDAEKMPLQAHKDGVNPQTGEIGGPKGAEPTRFGDWERKGRVFDF